MVIAGIPFTMPAVWIGLIVIFLVIEGLTAGLVTIWFAVGALAALIAAMFHAPLWLQLVWFFVISIAAFAVTRPLVKKYINGRTQPTNADMLIGQECLVTEDIDNLTGHGAVTGQIVNVLGDEAFLPDEHIGVGRLRAAVDIFFHQRPRHGKGRDRDDEKPHELQPQRRVEHGGNERGERTHGKPDRDETCGQPLNDQKDHDQADPDGRHGEGDPGNDHRQNLLCKRWEYAVRQCFAMEISYRIYGLKARKTPANRRMKFPDSFPLYFLKQLE